MTDKIRQVKQGRILNGERPAKTGAMAFFDFEELEVQVPASDVKPEAPVRPEVKALSMAWLAEAKEISKTAKQPSSLQPEEAGINFTFFREAGSGSFHRLREEQPP